MPSDSSITNAKEDSTIALVDKRASEAIHRIVERYLDAGYEIAEEDRDDDLEWYFFLLESDNDSVLSIGYENEPLELMLPEEYRPPATPSQAQAFPTEEFLDAYALDIPSRKFSPQASGQRNEDGSFMYHLILTDSTSGDVFLQEMAIWHYANRTFFVQQSFREEDRHGAPMDTSVIRGELPGRR